MTRFNVRILLFVILSGLLIFAFYYLKGSVQSDDGMIQGRFIEISSSIPGRVNFSVALNPGVEVHKGDFLLWIENHQFANQEIAAQYYSLKNLLNSLCAEIAGLEVESVFAEKNLQRANLLFKSNTISVKELEGRKTDCDRIFSQITLKKAHSKEIVQNLEEISAQLQKMKREEWRSPVNGVVWAVFAHAGEYRDKDTPLLTLVDKSELFVDAYWSEKHLRRLKLGRVAEIEAIATGDRFTGIIKSIRAGVGRVRFANPVQLPAESFKKRVVVTRINIAENRIPFNAEEFYGVGASVRARIKDKADELR
jgi:multidrug resistance efflux pump